VHGVRETTFPIGTLIVNVSGCLAIGFLAVALGGTLVREEYRAAILIGVLGGYTTYSTFGRETFALLQDGQWLAALLNIALSNVLALVGVWAGWAIAVRIYGAQVA
jgi:CrcB protein